MALIHILVPAINFTLGITVTPSLIFVIQSHASMGLIAVAVAGLFVPASCLSTPMNATVPLDSQEICVKLVYLHAPLIHAEMGAFVLRSQDLTYAPVL